MILKILPELINTVLHGLHLTTITNFTSSLVVRKIKILHQPENLYLI